MGHLAIISVDGSIRQFLWLLFHTPAFLFVIGFCIWIIASSFMDEAEGPLQNWWKRKRLFHDSLQSPNLRHLAEKLTAPHHTIRMQAIEVLRQINDPTAVPTLLHALDRFSKDIPYRIAIVNLLGQLGDNRALPALRKLARARSLPLQFAAQQAISAIEPHAVLLRASESPAGSFSASAQSLLRPAMPMKVQDDAEMQLRASGGEGRRNE